MTRWWKEFKNKKSKTNRALPITRNSPIKSLTISNVSVVMLRAPIKQMVMRRVTRFHRRRESSTPMNIMKMTKCKLISIIISRLSLLLMTMVGAESLSQGQTSSIMQSVSWSWPTQSLSGVRGTCCSFTDLTFRTYLIDLKEKWYRKSTIRISLLIMTENLYWIWGRMLKWMSMWTLRKSYLISI